MSGCGLLALLVFVTTGCGQPGPSSPTVPVLEPTTSGREATDSESKPLEVVDVTGATHRPFDDAAVRAVVFVFLLSDCPISNSYAPELNRLHADYEPRGVRFFLLQVDPGLSIEAARQHAREFELKPPVVLDTRHEWVRKLGATISPEAAVLSPTGELIYIGRIDDRYIGFGKRRAEVGSHDLREALDAVVAGKPVPQARIAAVGCDIPNIPAGE